MSEMRLADAYAALRPSAYGIGLLALCTYVGMSEGFDVQVMALAAPLVSKQWALSPGATGLLLAASVIGQVAGSFLLTPLADRWGRRPAILLALLVAALATTGGAFAPSYSALMATRFVAGLGLGLALSSTTAMAMELVPLHWRTIAVVVVCCGYPLGAAAGIAIVGPLLPVYGFAAVFYVGGAGTFAALLLCGAFLPESPVILARRPDAQDALRRLLARLGLAVPQTTRVVAHEESKGASPVAALFAPVRRNATLLLWLLNFANLSLVYFFVMWLPSLFVSAGMSSNDALVATSVFSASGIVGGLSMAALLPRLGPIATLGGCYAITVVSVLVFSTLRPADAAFPVVLAICGAMVVGSQFSLSAVVNQFYPAEMRATGAGYALGAGRFGAILAPIVGGLVIARVGSPATAFAVGAVPAVLSLIAIVALRRSSAWRSRPIGGLAQA